MNNFFSGKTYGRMWMTRKTCQKFASLAFLNNSWTQMERKNSSSISFLLIQFVRFGFPIRNEQSIILDLSVYIN